MQETDSRFVPREEIEDWATKSMHEYLRFTIPGLERELNYWQNLTPEGIRAVPEKFHHTTIYEWGVYFNMLPIDLRLKGPRLRDLSSLTKEEKTSLENFFFLNKEKFLAKFKAYIFNYKRGAEKSAAFLPPPLI